MSFERPVLFCRNDSTIRVHTGGDAFDEAPQVPDAKYQQEYMATFNTWKEYLTASTVYNIFFNLYKPGLSIACFYWIINKTMNPILGNSAAAIASLGLGLYFGNSEKKWYELKLPLQIDSHSHFATQMTMFAKKAATEAKRITTNVIGYIAHRPTSP